MIRVEPEGAPRLPSTISVANARLPQTYENAKTALANCASIDECQDWADKAEALASYAKMADDDTLRKLADRIQARAVRRCGELLKQYDGRGRPENREGALPKYSQAEVAREAGLSPHQTKQAVRVANVPAERFEREVESEKPPTISQLAIMARNARPAPPPPPQGFAEATHLLGSVKRFAEFCGSHDPVRVAGGVLPTEVRQVREQVSRIDAWLDQFVVNLKG